MRARHSRHVYPPEPFKRPDFEVDVGGLTAKERRGIAQGPDNEIFPFYDHKLKMSMVFHIESIRQDIAANKVKYVVGRFNITMEAYLIWLRDRGVEEDYVARLDKNRLETPIIFGVWPDTEWVLIDGVHRAIKRFRAGLHTGRAIVLYYEQWRNYLLDLERTTFTDKDGATVDLLGVKRLLGLDNLRKAAS
jgi:hypothetical protein